ncbi:MAG: hypothetical protein CVV27_18120 [Candidatus Melainabacteria bacterium HGW-Melainabacteria-1]|nr:MAG: hypothetical protein CVV27_18120 [Candidatus Melainabacteria bacterium HGW-Melainabacteria-1]
MLKMRHQDLLDRFRDLPLISRILARLLREQNPIHYYHCAQHTQDVLGETLLFASHDGVSERELELLAIAAAYHDAGYLEQYAANEPIGAKMAAEAMREAGYSESDIDTVGLMILSTQIGPGPMATSRKVLTPLAIYLLDADWGAFGREDFFEKVHQLIDETGVPQPIFYRETQDLLRAQTWLSPGAAALRNAKKLENLAALTDRIEALS